MTPILVLITWFLGSLVGCFLLGLTNWYGIPSGSDRDLTFVATLFWPITVPILAVVLPVVYLIKSSVRCGKNLRKTIQKQDEDDI